jgi:hypothetical protein
MHPIYTRGFFRCLTRVSPSVAAPSSKKMDLTQIYKKVEAMNSNFLAWIKLMR